MSLVVFSSSMSATPTPAKSQPARVNGTHGAGVFFPPNVVRSGVVSFGGLTESVQYWNDEAKSEPAAFDGSKNSKEFETVKPLWSG